MDWLVFGDDWGAHPSTTQHLMRAMGPHDTVVWVDSIGMRRPKLNITDGKRIMQRLSSSSSSSSSSATLPPQWRRVSPKVVPLHEVAAVRGLNRQLLARGIAEAAHAVGLRRPHVLAANPVVALYLDALLADVGLTPSSVGYLRLDDYSLLPGVDASLVALAEPQMMRRADHVFATATRLLPVSRPGTLVPQGVDTAHFAQVPVAPPLGRKTLGFFGLIAEWIDLELIAAVAAAVPEWCIEVVGPTRVPLTRLQAQPNIRLVGPVPYSALPAHIAHWHAAWLPFVVDDLSAAVNPVKLREYLAAGLPTMSVPLPEVMALPGTDTAIISDADSAARWLTDIAATDTALARVQRRQRMAGESWQARAAQVRTVVMGPSSSSSSSSAASASQREAVVSL